VTWRIERFDHTNRRAYARKVDSDYFTDAETNTEVRVLRLEAHSQRERGEHPVPPEILAAGAAGTSGSLKVLPNLAEGEDPPSGEDYSVWRGEVHVTTLATQYKKVRFYSRENVGAGEIHLPPEELTTEAFVLTLSEPTAADLGLAGGDRGAAWRGMGNLIRRVAPLYVRCSPSDLGISTQVRSPHFQRPTLYLYDRVQGGVGLGELVFREHRSLLLAARQVLVRCSCTQGCPACVGPLAEVGPLGKETAFRLLEHLATGPGPHERAAPEGVDAMAGETGAQ